MRHATLSLCFLICAVGTALSPSPARAVPGECDVRRSNNDLRTAYSPFSYKSEAELARGFVRGFVDPPGGPGAPPTRCRATSETGVRPGDLVSRLGAGAIGGDEPLELRYVGSPEGNVSSDLVISYEFRDNGTDGGCRANYRDQLPCQRASFARFFYFANPDNFALVQENTQVILYVQPPVNNSPIKPKPQGVPGATTEVTAAAAPRSPVAEPGAVLIRRERAERRPDSSVEHTFEMITVFSDGAGNVREERGDEVRIRRGDRVVTFQRGAQPATLGTSPARPAEPDPEAERLRDAVAEYLRTAPPLPEPEPAHFSDRQDIGEREIGGVRCTGTRIVASVPAWMDLPETEEIYDEWRDAETGRLVQQVHSKSDGSVVATTSYYELPVEIRPAMFQIDR
jgi:hypothetical protein